MAGAANQPGTDLATNIDRYKSQQFCSLVGGASEHPGDAAIAFAISKYASIATAKAREETLGSGFGHRFDRVSNADLAFAKAA
jgi:hypothetical protein